MSLFSAIEQAAVRAVLLKIMAGAVACLLLIAVGSASVAAFMVIAADYGPAVAGATVAGGSIVFAALVVFVAWALVMVKKSAASTSVPSEKRSGPNGQEDFAKQRADEKISVQLARLIEQNPMASAGVALVAGIAVSSNPGLVQDVLKGIKEANK